MLFKFKMQSSTYKTNLDYKKCLKFIDDSDNLVSQNKLVKRCNVKPKIARRALMNHKNTVLCEPNQYGSNQYKNYRLYKKITDQEILDLFKYEIDRNIKNKNINKYNINYYINTKLVSHMKNRYNLTLNNDYNFDYDSDCNDVG